jgi:predicted transport protein
MPISINQYIDAKHAQRYVGLLHQLIAAIQAKFPDAELYAIPRYVAFKKRYNFVSLWLRHDSIFVETKRPKTPGLIGDYIADTHQYTLNYRMIITEPNQIDSMLQVIQESYRQTR